MLQLTREEKKARLFLPPNQVCTARGERRGGGMAWVIDWAANCLPACLLQVQNLDQLKARLYEDFPVMGMPHDLVAKIRGPGSGKEDVEAGVHHLDLMTQADLDQALEQSKAANHFLQVDV